MPMSPSLVSVHGGHSGQFCCHARDSLEAVVRAYIDQGFAWVGLSEHMPPPADKFLYPEERRAGLDFEKMQARFGAYMAEARRLQRRFGDRIGILVGFEAEACTGSAPLAARLLEHYQPDYVVGGVHHVDDIPFDYNEQEYQRAVQAAGGPEGLYCRYFDLQYEQLQWLRPSVVAHFDLIRLYDPEYTQHLTLPAVQERVGRNLGLIRDLRLILDFNVAALRKGASEPYLSGPILARAIQMGIPVVPGDDSHGVAMAGAYVKEGIAILRQMGGDTTWPKPGRCRFNREHPLVRACDCRGDD
jgi:histidinol-phosphatase (PHP family)